jgi:DNA/RNA endonuclease G (NUC1)
MPNTDKVEHRWDRYRTSVRKVEELTGYTFFDNVPADVIGPLKLQVDDERISMPRTARADR